jgi:hypothetical protein
MWAKDAVKEAKKMIAILDESVKEKITKKEGGEFTYDSGKGPADITTFILYRMYNDTKE